MTRTRSARTKGKARPQGRPRASTAGGQRGRDAQVDPALARQAPHRAARDTRQTTTGQAAVATRPAADAGAAAAAGRAPTWLQLSTLILSLGGLGISIYLTIAHYSASVALACPNTGSVNCEKVITSPESEIFGIPVAVLGLAFFVFMVAVNNPLAWRARPPLIHLSRVLSVVAGMGFVIYLIYVELFEVNAICLWCTGVHLITFALFVLVLLAAALWGVSETAER